MTYLTSTHQTPPAFVAKDGMFHPTAEALAQQDSERLAELDIWQHVTAEGDAPLGYTDWEFEELGFTRQPAGTEAEIAAALEQQAAEALAQRRASLSCTPRQARLALSQQGLLAAVEAFVATGSDALRIEWQYATEIRRTWPPVAEFAVANDLSDEALDALFELAATL